MLKRLKSDVLMACADAVSLGSEGGLGSIVAFPLGVTTMVLAVVVHTVTKPSSVIVAEAPMSELNTHSPDGFFMPVNLGTTSYLYGAPPSLIVFTPGINVPSGVIFITDPAALVIMTYPSADMTATTPVFDVLMVMVTSG